MPDKLAEYTHSDQPLFVVRPYVSFPHLFHPGNPESTTKKPFSLNINSSNLQHFQGFKKHKVSAKFEFALKHHFLSRKRNVIHKGSIYFTAIQAEDDDVNVLSYTMCLETYLRCELNAP